LRRPLDSAQQVPTIITPTEEIRPAVIAKQPHEKAVPAPPKDPLAKSGSRSNGGNRLRHDDTLPKTAAKDIADQNERLRIIEQTRARLLGIPATLPVSPAPINQHAKQQSVPSSPTAAAAVDIGKSSQHAIKQQQQQQQPSQKVSFILIILCCLMSSCVICIESAK
jgi:hypothetical protein